MIQHNVSDMEDSGFEERILEMEATISAGFKKSYAAGLAGDAEEKERAKLSICLAAMAMPVLLKEEEKKLRRLLKVDHITDDEQKVAQLLSALRLTAKLTRIWMEIMREGRRAAAVRTLGYTVLPALDAIGTGRRTALIPFLDSDDKDLRRMAAGGLLNILPERATSILKNCD